MTEDLRDFANFLFEAGMLQKTPRSGFHFLGSGSQSVAEHIHRVCYIGFVLAEMHGNVDSLKILLMCLFHDTSESRISDLNYVHQKYTTRDEVSAMNDQVAHLPFGKKLLGIHDEYHERESVEAKLAKDADNIEFLLSLKEQSDIGNKKADTWIPSLLKRMLTEEGRNLATTITTVPCDEWWFKEKDDSWWVDRSK